MRRGKDKKQGENILKCWVTQRMKEVIIVETWALNAALKVQNLTCKTLLLTLCGSFIKAYETVNIFLIEWELGKGVDNMNILFSIYICLNGKFIDLERQANPPLSYYLFMLSVEYLMITDLFVFHWWFWKGRRVEKGVYKQNEGDRRSEGVWFTQTINSTHLTPIILLTKVCERPWKASTRDLQWRVII